MKGALAPDPSLAALREQLIAAAAAFTDDAQPLGALLRALIDDVARAAAEPLEIFPVKHHSPSSAIHMVERLRQRPPRVIFMEGCEDLIAALPGLVHCRFPVALQAFAPEAAAFPADWSPLNLVLPLTDFSAEYQAIAFCLANPNTQLVFVDRSADHVFQWTPREGPPPGHDDEVTDEGGNGGAAAGAGTGEEGDGGHDTGNLHGGAVGLQIGRTEPTFGDFLEVLLKNARVRHYSEWWTQYVEGPTLGAEYGTYRHVMFLVASLLRRIGIRAEDLRLDEQRERYMWARMRRHLREHAIDARDALYVCGAVHAVSPIEEFGARAEKEWEIPPRTATKWLYGVVPSSFAAIERQFDMPAGEIAIAQRMWEKALAARGIAPFKIEKLDDEKKGKKGKKEKGQEKEKEASKEKAKGAEKKKSKEEKGEHAALPAAGAEASGGGLHGLLTRPPAFIYEDDAQLVEWSVEIVRLARKNGYLASTADTIAIHHTARLLARLRDRPHPSPYDFREAAITCLEKDRVPGKRDVHRLVDILLGGDRLGRVGYESLPPCAQDVYDRLAVLGLDLKASRIQRALMDFDRRPELLPASDLLWRLRYLGVPVNPIMGEKSLGHRPRQESWDIAIGKQQGALIQLGYEGATVEQVLEKRLKDKAYKDTARTVTALGAAEDGVLYLGSGRLGRELGLRAVALLQKETGANDAPEIFQRIRRLIHYYRTIGLPDWIKEFVSTGYQHYATLLPQSFADRGTTPQQLAAMLAFIFTQEALALSVGCSRSQLLIAVEHAAPEDPPKKALLWAAEWVLGLRGEAEIRAEFTALLSQPLLLPAFPDYVAGFLMALEFTPRITRLAVELMTRAFAELPEEVLLPWLPKLVVSLRPLGSQVTATLVKEAGLAFPRKAGELPAWEFAWERKRVDAAQAKGAAQADGAAAAANGAAAAANGAAQAGATTGIAGAGATPTIAAAEVVSGPVGAVAAMLRAHPESIDAIAARLGFPTGWSRSEPAVAADPGALAPAAPPPAATAAGTLHAAPAHPAAELLAAHPESLRALAALVAPSRP